MRLLGKKWPPPIVATHRPSFVNNVSPPPPSSRCEDVAAHKHSRDFRMWLRSCALDHKRKAPGGPRRRSRRRSWVYSLVVIDACRLPAAQMDRLPPSDVSSARAASAPRTCFGRTSAGVILSPSSVTSRHTMGSFREVGKKNKTTTTKHLMDVTFCTSQIVQNDQWRSQNSFLWVAHRVRSLVTWEWP